MSQIALVKLTKINAQIAELERDRKEIRDALNHTLLDLLNQKSLADTDFEMLVGGILSVHQMLLSDDPSHQKQKETWKKEGALYQASRKKSIKKKAA